MAETFTDLYVGNMSLLSWPYELLPRTAAVAIAVVIVLLPWFRNAEATAYATFMALTVFLYGVFLGLFNVAEAARFMANIQDIAVLSMVLFIAIAISQAHRAAIVAAGRLFARRTQSIGDR
jgi:hypothetical protein